MEYSRIAEERKKLGLSQEDLATKLNISQKSISKYECGTRRPSYETLVSMSSIFGVSIDYLLGNDNSLPSTKTSDSIKYWVEKTGNSYSEISQKLGISETLFLEYLNARTDMPYPTLIALSKICEVSTDCLLGMVDKSREKDLNDCLPFQYNYEIALRIRKLCNKNGIDTNSSFLENLLCLSSKEVFHLIEYGFVPHVETIIKLAQYFKVSTDYLLCQIDEQEERVLNTFCQLNEDNKDIMMGEMKKCLKEQQYESAPVNEPSKKTGTNNQ